MFIINRILFKSILMYFIYAFMFAVMLFSVQTPKEKQDNDNFFNESDIKIKNQDRVSIVESGNDGILVRLNLIRNAKETVDISYYTLIEGETTDIILGSVVEAANRGVKVRIILDGMFHNLKGSMKSVKYGIIDHPNIELKLFEPFKLTTPRTWNNRLHDKIIIVDQKLALIGGRNIGDKYFVKEEDESKFTKDRDVVIFDDSRELNKDSSVYAMQEYYNEIFNYKQSKHVSEILSNRRIKKGKEENNRLEKVYLEYKERNKKQIFNIDWHEKTEKTDGIKFVYNPIERGNSDPWVLRTLLSLAKNSKKSIFVQSPYVIPTQSMQDKFTEANLDSSKIKILTNSLSSSPNPVAVAGYSNYKELIVDSGVNLYEYQGPKSIHGKTYIYDKKISAIGSFNFDARSSFLNSESMVIIYGEEFAEKLMDNIHIDLNNSLKVNKDYTYIEDSQINEGAITKSKKAIIKVLSKFVYFLDYLL